MWNQHIFISENNFELKHFLCFSFELKHFLCFSFELKHFLASVLN
uniref:Uncharacterized protein n=1 Tax=Meloidogyne enterolobii TaxID=390850 RepID=A0A6V7YDN3_MELEN|nr:unnamed protein product [Meloidogyne enterolobii]